MPHVVLGCVMYRYQSVPITAGTESWAKVCKGGAEIISEMCARDLVHSRSFEQCLMTEDGQGRVSGDLEEWS